jgi:Inner spore coat protein D.
MFKQNCCNKVPMGCCERQIVEQVVEPTMTKCVERNFMHEVPHVCPMHTHVVNKHIYHHTYTPQYTCSEENVVINNDCGSCCNFR